jgi:flagellar biogenesis protein FliO
MRNFLVLLAMVLIMLSKANAEVRISGVEFKKADNMAKVIVNYKGDIGEIPSIQYKTDTVQLTVPEGVVWPQINKMVELEQGNRDTKLMAYQYDKKTARIRAVLPFNTDNIKDKVQLDVLANKMVLNIPLHTKKVVKTVVKKTAPKKEINESYLNKLLDESSIKKDLAKKDTIKTKLSGLEKDLPSENKKSFSVIGYAGKFVAFLGVVLLFFYGIVSMLRKGVSKKGRMSFLGSTKQIEVLSTTYVSPKKQLMLVKAHKQVFLVSNTDQGLSFLSEVKDPVGLLKGEEQDIAGTNFDLNLNSASKDENIEDKVKLKENPLSLSEFISGDKNEAKTKAPKKESKGKAKAKFSDQLKKKVKDLKPLQ